LRVEWTKLRARAHRWDEEVELVVEEMRRVLFFLNWKARWWMEQGENCLNVTAELREGLQAYAAKQASVLKRMAQYFASQWRGIHSAYNITAEWPDECLEDDTMKCSDNDDGMDVDVDSD